MTIETSAFDISEYLDSPEMIAEYINAMIEDGDEQLLLSALGDVAKAKGISKVAKEAKINRQNMYKAFEANANPRLATVGKVLHSMGLKLQVVAA